MIAEDMQSNPKYLVDGIDSARINKHYRNTSCKLCESSTKCYLFEDELTKMYICQSCYNWLSKKMENRKKIEELENY